MHQGKKKYVSPKPEPSPKLETKPVGHKFETPEPKTEPAKAAKADLRVVVKDESTARGHGFKLPNEHKVDIDRTAAVSNRIAGKVLQHHAGGVMLVDLGSDSPLSSLHQLLRPDVTEDVVLSGAECHCSDVESLAQMCECALLICWSRSGSCELYGTEHSKDAMYVVIVDTGLGSTKRYYVLSGNVGEKEYAYNLVNLSVDLVRKLTEDTTSGCRGSTGDLGDGVTHFTAVAIKDIILDVSE